jgi:hypothetical protein
MTDERSALIEAVAANDGVADELAALIAKSGIGTAKCAGLMTRALSDGKRYFVTSKEGYERDLELRFEKGKKAAIASVIAHATGDEAVDRAVEMHHDLTHLDTGWTWQDAMKAAILAAFNERQS